MDTDFQAKVEKYESKAAQYREAALNAAEGAQRTMCEGSRAIMTDSLRISARRWKSERAPDPATWQSIIPDFLLRKSRFRAD